MIMDGLTRIGDDRKTGITSWGLGALDANRFRLFDEGAFVRGSFSVKNGKAPHQVRLLDSMPLEMVMTDRKGVDVQSC